MRMRMKFTPFRDASYSTVKLLQQVQVLQIRRAHYITLVQSSSCFNDGVDHVTGWLLG